MSDISLVNELHDLIYQISQNYEVYDVGEPGSKNKALVIPEHFLLDINQLRQAVEEFRNGDFAFSSGQGLEFNPHDEDSSFNKYWVAGHKHREKVHRDEMELITLKERVDKLVNEKLVSYEKASKFMESLRYFKNKIFTAPKFRPMSRKDILFELSKLHI